MVDLRKLEQHVAKEHVQQSLECKECGKQFQWQRNLLGKYEIINTYITQFWILFIRLFENCYLFSIMHCAELLLSKNGSKF